MSDDLIYTLSLFWGLFTLAWLIFTGLGTWLADEVPTDGSLSRRTMARGLLLTPIWPLVLVALAVAVVAFTIAAIWRIAFPR